MIVIEDKDVLETKVNDSDVVIRVRAYDNLAQISPPVKPYINWSEFWGDLACDFLSQEFIIRHNFTTEEKQEMTRFFKNKVDFIKRKFK